MHRLKTICAALALNTLPAFAQTPMTADEFDAYVTGKTLSYHAPASGTVFGTEEYLPGRKVRWNETSSTCSIGRWYVEGQDICFIYDDDPEPVCWTYWLHDGKLLASPAEDYPEASPYDVLASATPLSCSNPQTGN
jgi:hypothetical protein